MAGFDKVVGSYAEAMEGLEDGMTVIAGGFGLCGIPENLIAEIKNKGTRELTIVSINCGVDGFGLGILLEDKQVKKMISSYVGENAMFEKQLLNGELEVELTPQGPWLKKCVLRAQVFQLFIPPLALVRRSRKAKIRVSFMAVNTCWKNPFKEIFAIVKGWKADRYGNVMYRHTAQNFNPMAATAGKITVVEVEELVDVGELEPSQIHTPGIYVNRLIVGSFEKRIEKRTVSDS
jgi:3-oxoacid CoA-transferase subunit A